MLGGAVVEDAEGLLRLEQTDVLRAYQSRNPEFRFAVVEMDTGIVLPGSSTELAGMFTGPNRTGLFASTFHLVGDQNPQSRGLARAGNTPYGRMIFIVYGPSFHWEDIFRTIYIHVSTQSFVTYLTLATVIALVGYVSVRRGLAPLRLAAAQAARIDADCLHQRIAIGGLPSEVTPFVEAMNGALARVDDGIARQRRFLANAAHELRTPITILCAHVENPDRATFEEDIKKGVYRVHTIVEQLLSVARLSSRKDAVDQEIDLGKAMLSAILDYMPLAVESDRNIELEQPPSPTIVRAISWALESVMTNLLENAVRAEPTGGTILVRVRPEATVEVIDHGEGVALDDREAIFEPFWRKNDATRGAGLGLAITKELMDRQGGRIWVEETPGGGATFKLSFQRAAGRSLASRMSADSPAPFDAVTFLETAAIEFETCACSAGPGDDPDGFAENDAHSLEAPSTLDGTRMSAVDMFGPWPCRDERSNWVTVPPSPSGTAKGRQKRPFHLREP
ncbi:sensor histidine kinase [Methylocapsa aurea]|uniref:sensor histidine kinase n=1 Tax=Methylocapsa aurea TaxID=663610 RepID=UPI003D18AB22